MLNNNTPLNWHGTLRRLRKEGDMGQLGRDIGILPGRKTFSAQLMGLTTKHKPTHIISEAAAPESKAVKAHRANKKVKSTVKSAGATGEYEGHTADTNQKITEALEAIPTGPGAPHTPQKAHHHQTQKDLSRALGTPPTDPTNRSDAYAAADAAAKDWLERQPDSVKNATKKRVKSPQNPNPEPLKEPTPEPMEESKATIHAATAALLSPSQSIAISSRAPINSRVTPPAKAKSKASKLAPKSRRKKEVSPMAPFILPDTPSPAPKRRVGRPRKEKQTPLEVDSIAQPVFITPKAHGKGIGPMNVKSRRVRKMESVAPPTPPMETITTPEPPIESTQSQVDTLKSLKWPGTVKLAKSKGLTDDKIAEITGQPIHERGNTPARTKKLKAYLRNH